MKKMLFIFGILSVFSLAYAQGFEGFENGNFLSYDWQFSGNSVWFITFEESFGGVYSAQSGAIGHSQNSGLQISLETVAAGEISFHWKVSSQQYADFLRFYVDNVLIAGISGSTEWALFTHNVSAGMHTFCWKYEKNQMTTGGLDAGWIDNITFPATTTATHDLAAKTVLGNSAVYQGSSNIYNVIIKNYGSSAEESYTVRLLREGSILLDELSVSESLPSEAEIIHQLVWIIPPNEPTANTYVYAEVILTGDEFPANNITADHSVNIYEIGLAQIYVGNQNEETNWYPFKFHMNYSLAETIYFQPEIVYTGNIHAIGYRKHFLSTIVNTPIRVYMNTVSQSTLTNGWIPASSLIQVFNGNISIGPGYGTVTIPLDNIFAYNGGNLCVMTYHQHDGNTYHIDDKFVETIVTPYYDRTRALGSNTSFSPTSPPSTGYLFSRYPNTIFYMDITGLGVLEGTVYDDQGNLLATAEIIKQPFAQTVTNGAGFYRYGNTLQGTFNVTASKTGYVPQTLSAIIVADQTTVLDFVLTPLPKVQVFGQIFGSDNLTSGLADADIYLFGQFDYQTVSAASGDFLFPAVYANVTYTMAISRYSYDTIWQSVPVGSLDLDLGTIIMTETALPPNGLYAQQNFPGTEVLLTWNAQKSFNRSFEGYDIYRFQESFFATPSEWTTIASAVSDTFFVDTGWASQPASVYQFALTALYTNSVASDTIFSNTVIKYTGNSAELPDKPTALHGIYPNPFNPNTNISFSLSGDAQVELTAHNVRGQKVATILSQWQQEGFHHAVWNGRDDLGRELASGIYLIGFRVDGRRIAVQKCILLK